MNLFRLFLKTTPVTENLTTRHSKFLTHFSIALDAHVSSMHLLLDSDMSMHPTSALFIYFVLYSFSFLNKRSFQQKNSNADLKTYAHARVDYLKVIQCP